MTAIRALRELTSADAATAGPKAAHLGEMLHHDYPVPPGFVITTEVYGGLFKSPDACALIAGLLATVDVEDPEGLRAAALRMQTLIRVARLAEPYAAQIVDAYRELAAPAVAVRSSATAEDLPNASFAGQQDSFLNVREAEGVLAAVDGCWQSVFSERAIYYRQSRGFDHVAVRSAVVVQQMVQARAAGVAFSLNPVTGNTDDLLVEASFGLGEAVVAGEVTPDLYVLDKATLAVRQRVINEQSWGYYCDPGGGGTVKLPVPEPGAPVLADGELRAIGVLVRELEAHFGCPQDVEWAVDAQGSVFLLQARPITAWS
jgi:phosphoenolpyruvate synthase/pyruvate phosphate dikinase